MEAVDPAGQLRNIRNLKIYDYLVQSRKERGVLAQELAQTIPNAVHVVGDVDIDDVTIPNFLVVNERVLLFENIGATQHLDREVEADKKAIVDITSRVDTLEKDTAKESDTVRSLLRRAVYVLTDSEKAPYDAQSTPAVKWVERVNYGLTWFSIGPSRSLWILGFFIPPAWIVGSFYIFSKLSTRRAGGILNFVMFVIYLILSILYHANSYPPTIVSINNNRIMVASILVGALFGCLLITVRRIRKQMEKKKKKENLERLRLELLETIQKHADGKKDT